MLFDPNYDPDMDFVQKVIRSPEPSLHNILEETCMHELRAKNEALWTKLQESEDLRQMYVSLRVNTIIKGLEDTVALASKSEISSHK